MKVKTSIDQEYYQVLLDELNVKSIEIDKSLEHDIYLDVTITEELKNEGDMRELVRKIQDMRKEAGFEPKDRVVVSLTDTEPDWFGSVLGDDLVRSVGADRVDWGNENEQVEKI
jgi:isoleucyl-tRNA synthetase